MPGPGQSYEGLATKRMHGGDWTGEVRLIEHLLDQPLHWRYPKRIFVNSMSDLFHDDVPDDWIDRIMVRIALCGALKRGHLFQILTKRAVRQYQYLSWDGNWSKRLYKAALVDGFSEEMACRIWNSLVDQLGVGHNVGWPMRNVHVGVSVENQRMQERIEWLRQTPAAVRFLSCEPLLEDLGTLNLEGIHQVIIGGESGPHRRPPKLEWIESLAAQCQAAGIATFTKQDSALRPGQQGRISDKIWQLKQFPGEVGEPAGKVR